MFFIEFFLILRLLYLFGPLRSEWISAFCVCMWVWFFSCRYGKGWVTDKRASFVPCKTLVVVLLIPLSPSHFSSALETQKFLNRIKSKVKELLSFSDVTRTNSVLTHKGIFCFIMSLRFSPYEWETPHICQKECEGILVNHFSLLNSLWFTIGECGAVWNVGEVIHYKEYFFFWLNHLLWPFSQHSSRIWLHFQQPHLISKYVKIFMTLCHFIKLEWNYFWYFLTHSVWE